MFEVKEHLIKLQKKDYLQVMWRLVWFREEKPDWCIDTQLVSHSEANKAAVFCAKIYDEKGVQKASGYGSESASDFRDYLEKAETKAIGRALAMLGYGTQFAPELDEGTRIVDSPVERPNRIDLICEDCGCIIEPYVSDNGEITPPQVVAARAKKRYGKSLCVHCAVKARDALAAEPKDAPVEERTA